MLIQAYLEGIGVDGIFVAHRGTSGFEALRLLGKEFSLRTRAEASFFRAEVMKRTYKAENSSTQISDVVRKMDVDLSRYRKLTDTLPVKLHGHFAVMPSVGEETANTWPSMKRTWGCRDVLSKLTYPLLIWCSLATQEVLKSSRSSPTWPQNGCV